MEDKKILVNLTLRNIRNKEKMTQAEIVEKSGLSKQMVSKMEHCDGNPTLSTLIKYCECIGIDLADAIQYYYTQRVESHLLTNFRKNEEPFYREAINKFGNNKLFISKDAYWVNGYKDDNMMALRCKGSNPKDIADFWWILHTLLNNKEESENERHG